MCPESSQIRFACLEILCYGNTKSNSSWFSLWITLLLKERWEGIGWFIGLKKLLFSWYVHIVACFNKKEKKYMVVLYINIGYQEMNWQHVVSCLKNLCKLEAFYLLSAAHILYDFIVIICLQIACFIYASLM